MNILSSSKWREALDVLLKNLDEYPASVTYIRKTSPGALLEEFTNWVTPTVPDHVDCPEIINAISSADVGGHTRFVDSLRDGLPTDLIWLNPIVPEWFIYLLIIWAQGIEILADPDDTRKQNLISPANSKSAFVRCYSGFPDLAPFTGALEINGNYFGCLAGTEKSGFLLPSTWKLMTPHDPKKWVLPVLNSPLGIATIPNLPVMVAKLAVWFTCWLPRDGTYIEGEVVKLAEELFPSSGSGRLGFRDRRNRMDDLASATQGLQMMREIKFAEVLNNTVIRDHGPMVEGYVDLTMHPEQNPRFRLRWNDAFRRMLSLERDSGADWMIIDATKLLSLPLHSHAPFALAGVLYRQWHNAKQKGVFLPERLHSLSVDDLMVLANTLPPSALRVLAAPMGAAPGDKNALLVYRSRLMDQTLPMLQEVGIIGTIESKRPSRGERNGTWSVRVLPPDDFIEACRIATRKRRQSSSARLKVA